MLWVRKLISEHSAQENVWYLEFAVTHFDLKSEVLQEIESIAAKMHTWNEFGSSFGQMFEPWIQNNKKDGVVSDLLRDLDKWSAKNLTPVVRNSLQLVKGNAAANIQIPKVNISIFRFPDTLEDQLAILAKPLTGFMNTAIMHVMYDMGHQQVGSSKKVPKRSGTKYQKTKMMHCDSKGAKRVVYLRDDGAKFVKKLSRATGKMRWVRV